MKTNRRLQKFIIRATVLSALTVVFFISGAWAQMCDKTMSKNQEKPLTERMADYALNGDLNQIKALVEENNSRVNMRLANEETMLTLAAWTGKYDVAEYLISKKANVNCRNDWQNTPLHNAVIKGFNDIVTLLISNGANVNARGENGNNSIMYAASNGHSETAMLLLKAGCNINAVNDYNQTALLQASWYGNADIIKLLVENGANVNYTTPEGNTAMHNLAGQGFADALKILIDHGADLNIVDANGQIPLLNALISNKSEVAALLIDKTKNVNLQENHRGNTPLHYAALTGNLKSTELLINAGAKADIKNNAQKTPIDYAVQYGYVNLVDYYAFNSLASKEMSAQVRKNQSAGLVKVSNGDAKVVYCGHSGWAVQTEKHLLIFDYWNRNKSVDGGLASGTICPKELKDKDVIVFVSHDHSDHYDTCIYAWAKDVKSITYVYGFKPEEAWVNKDNGYHGPKYVYINDNQTQKVDNTTITTLKSNDSGQGFLVTADGVTIYHPGDLAWFSASDETDFKKEVDFMASQSKPVDIAFLPVTGCPSRWKKEFIIEGFLYSMEKLNPAIVFPMHSFQREYMLKEFAELAEKKVNKSQVYCVDNNGDNYLYHKTMVTSK